MSQQLAKQLFHGEGSKFLPFRIVQKIKEWIIAIRLERQYTKNEILAMYCNVYDFGNYSVGVSSAAQTYFSKEPKDLTVDESAILVGMFKNSGLYNPIRNPEGVKNPKINFFLVFFYLDFYFRVSPIFVIQQLEIMFVKHWKRRWCCTPFLLIQIRPIHGQDMI